jgi:hypothetical protein
VIRLLELVARLFYQRPDVAARPLITNIAAEDPPECVSCGRKRVVYGNTCSECREQRLREWRDARDGR